MTKSRIRRIGSGYKASMAWATRPGTGTPDRHSERYAGRSDGSGRRRHILPREISGPVQSIGLPHGQPGGRGSEKSAEAIVVQPGEGPNLPMQGAAVNFDERGAADRGNAPRRRRNGRNSHPRSPTAATANGTGTAGDP